MTATELIIAILATIILGFSKAGFKGLGILIVTLFAIVFDAKASTGILLPLLVIADIFAIYHYRRDVDWKLLIKLMPWIFVGVIIATYVGDFISEAIFRHVMAVIILISVILMIAWDKISKGYVPNNIYIASFLGFLVGFTTMLGNLAGPVANVYFLALKFPKNAFIGTTAWMFFFVNIFKLPFHIFFWKTIDFSSLETNLILAPFAILGFYVGLWLMRYVSNVQFKYYIIGITFIGALFMLFGT